MCTFTSVCIPGGRECRGAHSGSKYCVYQHNESSEREKYREGEGEGEEAGWKGWRKPFSLCCFLPSRQPTPVVSIPSILHLPFSPFYFFAWPDQMAALSFSSPLTPSTQVLQVGLDTQGLILFIVCLNAVSAADIQY